MAELKRTILKAYNTNEPSIESITQDDSYLIRVHSLVCDCVLCHVFRSSQKRRIVLIQLFRLIESGIEFQLLYKTIQEGSTTLINDIHDVILRVENAILKSRLFYWGD